MSFIRFMLDGAPESHKRENFPENTVEATNTSYDYSGKITKQFYIPYLTENNNFESDQYKVCMVDNAVQIKVAVPQHGKFVKENLDGHATKANVTAFAGGAGFVYSLYKMATCDYVYGLGALASLGLTGLSLSRSYEASQESGKWNDPVQTVCNTRIKAAKDFNMLIDNNLRESHFTANETKDVFFHTMSTLSAEHGKNMSTGNPYIMMQSVKRFMKTNPVRDNNLDYAFPNEPEIYHPDFPMNGRWKREDLNGIALKSRRLALDYTLFQSETKRELQEIENNKNLVNTAVNSTNLLAHNLINGSVNNQLHANVSEHEAKLEELKIRRNRGLISDREYGHKSDEIVNERHQAANHTLHAGQQNSFFANSATLFVTSASNLYGKNQKEALKIARRDEFVKKFPEQIDDILKDYSSRRYGMERVENE